MEVLIFLVVIVVLIVVHEFGHFLVAKWSGMEVEEFGFGFPPRAALLGRAGETEITLNWLPFGGFVKIYGEEQVSGGRDQVSGARAFTDKNRFLQALVLVAGIAMNLLLAYLLISLALALGTPRALSSDELAQARDIELAVAQVVPGSPAASAGLMAGDLITSAQDAAGSWQGSQAADTGSFSDFVQASGGSAIMLEIERNDSPMRITATPAAGVAGASGPYALGVDIAPVGVLALSVPEAFAQGASLTWGATRETAAGLWQFFAGVFTFHADLSQVAGPVGIADALGGAAKQGFGDLLSLAAIISINLALINLIPVPALDGGRLLFVAVEAVIRRPIKPSVANAINSFGFALLILLMFAVTAHDLYKLA
ncbi:MAG TPA: M50 family metallopeptidase [Candidatus Paceibacterota bacterium]|nr:M50 family metallopeptidase [Candidatus Paceibacterota bacterium]